MGSANNISVREFLDQDLLMFSDPGSILGGPDLLREKSGQMIVARDYFPKKLMTNEDMRQRMEKEHGTTKEELVKEMTRNWKGHQVECRTKIGNVLRAWMRRSANLLGLSNPMVGSVTGPASLATIVERYPSRENIAKLWFVMYGLPDLNRDRLEDLEDAVMEKLGWKYGPSWRDGGKGMVATKGRMKDRGGCVGTQINEVKALHVKTLNAALQSKLGIRITMSRKKRAGVRKSGALVQAPRRSTGVFDDEFVVVVNEPVFLYKCTHRGLTEGEMAEVKRFVRIDTEANTMAKLNESTEFKEMDGTSGEARDLESGAVEECFESGGHMAEDVGWIMEQTTLGVGLQIAEGQQDAVDVEGACVEDERKGQRNMPSNEGEVERLRQTIASNRELLLASRELLLNHQRKEREKDAAIKELKRGLEASKKNGMELAAQADERERRENLDSMLDKTKKRKKGGKTATTGTRAAKPTPAVEEDATENGSDSDGGEVSIYASCYVETERSLIRFACVCKVGGKRQKTGLRATRCKGKRDGSDANKVTPEKGEAALTSNSNMNQGDKLEAVEGGVNKKVKYPPAKGGGKKKAEDEVEEEEPWLVCTEVVDPVDKIKKHSAVKRTELLPEESKGTYAKVTGRYQQGKLGGRKCWGCLRKFMWEGKDTKLTEEEKKTHVLVSKKRPAWSCNQCRKHNCNLLHAYCHDCYTSEELWGGKDEIEGESLRDVYTAFASELDAAEM